MFCAPHVSGGGQQYHTEKIVLNESSIVRTLGVSARLVDVSSMSISYLNAGQFQLCFTPDLFFFVGK